MENREQYSVGICLGASRVTAVRILYRSGRVESMDSYGLYHGGRVKSALRALLEENRLSVYPTAVTGRKFKNLVTLSRISEPEAVELAYGAVRDRYPPAGAIVSAGGETFMVYRLDDSGRISSVHTGGKCASGTGEFFLQQIKRLGIGIDQVPDLQDLRDPYPLSGRCSVFCKSDCTHALNKGERKDRVLAGLSRMMAERIIELLGKAGAGEIILTGGTARNRNMVRFLRESLERVTVPEEAGYFEALGAAIWAAENESPPPGKTLFRENSTSFQTLPPLAAAAGKVTYHTPEYQPAADGDRCILGIDVGSTTTKAVLVREADAVCLAGVYLRTDGDPVGAARKCYRGLAARINGAGVRIIQHSVTGSGRHIVALQGMSDCVVNEIIAHAEAALYFDPEVDTIFEIGGQDAKYTSITAGIPSDYAMNEACGAGTGSFLEEAAAESLNIGTAEIADRAMGGRNPVNFNDQCAAFISSDIKNAIQEGVSAEDISAGLVYSVCMNYSHRVKGSRPVGKKIFMQGGVCYNRAVPAAMASLTGTSIVVPPDPGLMGAFGVALVAARRLREGVLSEKTVSLDTLSGREIAYRRPFTCRGDDRDCDRKCSISVVEIEGKRYPFGGICNRYDNLFEDDGAPGRGEDLVSFREKLLHRAGLVRAGGERTGRPRVGINRSLNNLTLLPLFSGFLAELGLETVLPERIDPEGIARQSAPFCYPVEISHGYMADLLRLEPDYIFLPQVKGLRVPGGLAKGVACVLSQGEPYYLKAVFPRLRSPRVISPVLDFSRGFASAEKEFMAAGRQLGFSPRRSRRAYAAAVGVQLEFQRELKRTGRRVLEQLRRDPGRRAIVVFGRPYNAFASSANKGIPRKLATRGETVLTIDMLDLEDVAPPSTMYWASGQAIMQAAELVARHPQLFGVYVTNFSCGPDSFLTGYFRRRMGEKPSLILELDSHTADAGLDTRIDAYLDIIGGYSRLEKSSPRPPRSAGPFRPARITPGRGGLMVTDSSGESVSLRDDRVRVLLPSMGSLVSRGFAAALEHCGIKATPVPDPGEEELRRAKAYSTCKECLPLQLTLGSLLKYLDRPRDPEEILVYFMPRSDGPCRFGQYSVLMNNLLEDLRIPDVALLSPTSTDSYAGLDRRFARKAWSGLVTADGLECVRSSLLALAEDPAGALEIFGEESEQIFRALAGPSGSGFRKTLARSAERFSRIPLKKPYSRAGKVLLSGEIYVRTDAFSRRGLVEKLAARGIVTRIAPVYEWLYYTDYCVRNDLEFDRSPFAAKLANRLEGGWRRWVEGRIRKILAASGLCESRPVDVRRYIEAARGSISPHVTGEAILTIGSAYTEIIDEVSGGISLGPFGCMPARLAESVISSRLSEEKRRLTGDDGVAARVLEEFPVLPFLSLETDGNAFPQVTEARLEAFSLQVERLTGRLHSPLDRPAPIK